MIASFMEFLNYLNVFANLWDLKFFLFTEKLVYYNIRKLHTDINKNLFFFCLSYIIYLEVTKIRVYVCVWMPCLST